MPDLSRMETPSRGAFELVTILSISVSGMQL